MGIPNYYVFRGSPAIFMSFLITRLYDPSSTTSATWISAPCHHCRLPSGLGREFRRRIKIHASDDGFDQGSSCVDEAESVDYFSRAIDRVVAWDEDNGEA